MQLKILFFQNEDSRIIVVVVCIYRLNCGSVDKLPLVVDFYEVICDKVNSVTVDR